MRSAFNIQYKDFVLLGKVYMNLPLSSIMGWLRHAEPVKKSQKKGYDFHNPFSYRYTIKTS